MRFLCRSFSRQILYLLPLSSPGGVWSMLHGVYTAWPITVQHGEVYLQVIGSGQSLTSMRYSRNLSHPSPYSVSTSSTLSDQLWNLYLCHAQYLMGRTRINGVE